MVNMFSIGPMSGMYGMNSMYGMNCMYGSGGNAHRYFNSVYGIGYPDSGASRPYAQPYPMAITPRGEVAKTPQNWIKRLVQKLYG